MAEGKRCIAANNNTLCPRVQGTGHVKGEEEEEGEHGVLV
jgi:hypothetical protein